MVLSEERTRVSGTSILRAEKPDSVGREARLCGDGGYARVEVSLDVCRLHKMKAFANIDSDARYDIVVKFTNDGFKLSNLKLAGEDYAEGDAVFPPAKKAKKTAKKTAAVET